LNPSRLRTAFLSAVAAALFLLLTGRDADAKQLTYPQALDLAVAAMEEGKHIQALGPMRTALTADRNEPYGALALGTLYLHAGSPVRAEREFERARQMAPNEPLAAWGEALAQLAQGKKDVARFASIPASAIPAAPTVAAYVRLLNGQGAAIREETKDVTATEADPLRLELAAFAALRGGDAPRAETLLRALVARPDMKALAEDRAFLFLFLPDHPAQNGAPRLPTAIGFPEPAGGVPLSGTATLTPPGGMPNGAAMVSYSTEGGGGWAATTNNPPFVSQWNTANYPNGPYTIRTVAFDADRRIVHDSRRTYVVKNADAPPSRALSEDEREDMRQRLRVLLTPRASRKVAWFALSEQARLRGDDAAAQSCLECVVAIDPLFQDARSLLRDFRRGGDGPVAWWRGATTEKLVALTFDDGPNPLPHRTPALLDALKREAIPATFFVVGARAEQYPEIIRRMDAEGHELANHSYSHPNLTFLDAPAVERELGRTSVIIRDTIGKRPRFYRPPGGNFNHTVSDAADAYGMDGGFWTVDGIKFEYAPFTPAKLTQYVLGNLRPGAIILLHNAPENTIKALPQIVAGLRARGYEMVTMSELARRCRPAPGGPASAAYGAR
jgi:peptidoglycan/xylan/chitin deacetylase (PgdA/CDA1 family)